MDMDFDVAGAAAVQASFAHAAHRASREVGAANGAGADRIKSNVERMWAQRGWGATSRVWARRSASGPQDPDAYVFVTGGAAHQEDRSANPQPTLRPSADRELSWIEKEAARRLDSLL